MRFQALLILGLAGCGSVNSHDVDATPHPDTTTIPADSAFAPTVVSVSVPTAVDAEGATAMVSAVLHGQPNEQLSVAFTGTLGTYAPATQTVMTNATGDGVASTTFTSGLTGGSEVGAVTATTTAQVSSAAKPFGFPVAPLARYGQATAFATSGSFSQDYLLGETVTVSAAGKLKKIGFISITMAGPMIKVGIYSDVGGAPSALLAQIPATTIAVGINEIALTTPLALAAGNYWFMADYSASGGVGQDAVGGRSVKYVTLPFASALPATFPAPTSYTGNNFNYYLVFGQ